MKSTLNAAAIIAAMSAIDPGVLSALLGPPAKAPPAPSRRTQKDEAALAKAERKRAMRAAKRGSL